MFPVWRVFPVRSVPETSSPDDDVHPQVPVRREELRAFNLVENPKPLERAGDRVEERLVLVCLLSRSETDVCKTRVHVGRLHRSGGTSLPRVPQSP